MLNLEFSNNSKLYGIPVYEMTGISCKVQENFLGRYCVVYLAQQSHGYSMLYIQGV
jgi:hypothetical protein